MAKKEPKEIRMETLLAAAVEEFMQKGYEGASIDAIAAKAGVSKGGFYYHFPNKEVLLLEANKKISEPIAELAHKALKNPSAVAGMKQYIRDYLHYCIGRPKEMSFLFLSMSKSLESPTLIKYYREYIKETTAFHIHLFQKAATQGKIDVPDPEAYGISLMGALDGIVSYAMMNPQEDTDKLAGRIEQIWFGTSKDIGN